MAKVKPRGRLHRRRITAGVTILAVGVFTALFFRKDNFSRPSVDATGAGLALGEPVERRLTDGGRARQSLPATFKVPTAATGLGGEEYSSSEESPTYHRTLSPVAALLKPVTEEAAEPTEDIRFGGGDAAGGATTHTVVDGDTLTALAARYLGSEERYLEIYELNRDLLSSPDLLPIGRALKIPARQRAVASAPPAGAGN